MKKVRKGGRGVVNIWSLKEKISGMTFVNPNIPALKYRRDMEIEAVNILQTTTRAALFQTVGWFLTKNHAIHYWGKPRQVNVMFMLW